MYSGCRAVILFLAASARLSTPAGAAGEATAAQHFGVRVVDTQTQRGVPRAKLTAMAAGGEPTGSVAGGWADTWQKAKGKSLGWIYRTATIQIKRTVGHVPLQVSDMTGGK